MTTEYIASKLGLGVCPGVFANFLRRGTLELIKLASGLGFNLLPHLMNRYCRWEGKRLHSLACSCPAAGDPTSACRAKQGF